MESRAEAAGAASGLARTAAARGRARSTHRNGYINETDLRDLGQAAHAMGLQLHVVNAGTRREIDVVFAALMRERPDGASPSRVILFFSPAARAVDPEPCACAMRCPAVYPVREFAEAGGLSATVATSRNAYRPVGVYVGRILRATSLPTCRCSQASKLELVINRQDRQALGLDRAADAARTRRRGDQ